MPSLLPLSSGPFCFLCEHSDCRAMSPGSVCILSSGFLQLSELCCLPGVPYSSFLQWVWVSNILADTTFPGKSLGSQSLLVWILIRESRQPWIPFTIELWTPCCKLNPQKRQRNCGRWERFLLSPNLQPWNSLPNWAGSQLILPLFKCVKYPRDAGDSRSSSTSSGVIFDVLKKCDIRT